MVTYILKHVKKKRTDHMEINKIKSCQFGKFNINSCYIYNFVSLRISFYS